MIIRIFLLEVPLFNEPREGWHLAKTLVFFVISWNPFLPKFFISLEFPDCKVHFPAVQLGISLRLAKR